MSASSAVAADSHRFEPGLARRKLGGTIFLGLCLLAIFILLLALVLLLYDVLREGLPWLDADFLTGVPSRRPQAAGILPALVGSIQITILVGLMAFPVGVAAAVYSQEYAQDSFVNRLLRTNISNLAGVPSIIYGIFGLALFARALGFGYTIFTGRPDARPADPPRDHPRHDRGASRRSRIPSARAPTPSVPLAGRWFAGDPARRGARGS